MPRLFEHLRSEALQLSANERAELALILIQSLDGGADDDAEAAWDAELSRRLNQIERGEVAGQPAESVISRLREKHS